MRMRGSRKRYEEGVMGPACDQSTRESHMAALLLSTYPTSRSPWKRIISRQCSTLLRPPLCAFRAIPQHAILPFKKTGRPWEHLAIGMEMPLNVSGCCFLATVLFPRACEGSRRRHLLGSLLSATSQRALRFECSVSSGSTEYFCCG
jgi:hypothetical protein